MNIIRVENVKNVSATTYSLTVRVEKFKETKIQHVIVVLSEDDIINDNSLLKLIGVNIYVLLVPRKLRFTFNETEYFKKLQIGLVENHTITYF